MTPPRLLICGFGAFEAAPRNPSQAVVEALAAEGWRPAAAEARYLTLPVAWRGAVEMLRERTGFDGMLLTGVAVEATSLRVETLGRNTACTTRPDHDGALWPSPVILADGPASIAASAPCAQIVDALRGVGLPAELSDDAGDYLCNFSLYRMLAAAAAPVVGFLHLPQAREFADGAALGLADLTRGVRVAAETFAEALRDPDASRRTA